VRNTLSYTRNSALLHDPPTCTERNVALRNGAQPPSPFGGGSSSLAATGCIPKAVTESRTDIIHQIRTLECLKSSEIIDGVGFEYSDGYGYASLTRKRLSVAARPSSRLAPRRERRICDLTAGPVWREDAVRSSQGQAPDWRAGRREPCGIGVGRCN
jgi:hypothetical protein